MPKHYDRILQIELNEVSADIIHRLIHEGRMPFMQKSQLDWSFHRTQSESEYTLLEPWIQWVTAHTGKTYSEHGIFHLADGDELAANIAQIWEPLQAAGKSTCILGSMNTTNRGFSNGIFFPDPWSKTNSTYPEDLKPLWNLISSKVQTHVSTKIGLSDMLKGLKVALKFGVRPKTIAQLAIQIFKQKLNPNQKWKLAAIFDSFQTDMFIHLNKQKRFAFSTLFLNSVAHYQHHYWRRYEPEAFSAEFEYPDLDKSDDPIRFGYSMYDSIIQRIKQLQDDKTLIILCTGLSQQAYLHSESTGGLHYYRLINHKAFAEAIGLNSNCVYPLMSRDWQYVAENKAQCDVAFATLQALNIQGKPLFSLERNSDTTLFIETAYSEYSKSNPIIEGATISYDFNTHFTHIAIKSGSHTGEGYLWTSDKQSDLPEDFPLTDLFQFTKSCLIHE